MKKVLIISTVGLGYEGISSVIMNYSSYIPRENIKLEFATPNHMHNILRDKFLKIGPVYEIRDRKKDTRGYIKDLSALIKVNHYDVIHIHGNSGTMFLETMLGKAYGVRKIITHCHNTTCDHPLLNKLMTPVMKLQADTMIACSKQSGRWLYGKAPFRVINNAVEFRRFKYDESVREKYRRDLGLNKFYVVGHVGHFTVQKNHDFLIDAFASCEPIKNNMKLLLISDGPYYEEVKKKVSELDLSDSVIFLGRRNDAAQLYQAMDIFVLPSRWEGLPVVMIEAQISGLPLLVSDVITEDAKCTDKVYYKSLQDGPGSWGKEILHIRQDHFNRKGYDELCLPSVRKHGFDIEREAKILADIYLE
ncbi:MAG: glycosyltransferase [Candidatus Limivicinus sp.]|jgi:glycosyltransferase involved in cell wall biosynthesis